MLISLAMSFATAPRSTKKYTVVAVASPLILSPASGEGEGKVLQGRAIKHYINNKKYEFDL